MLALLTWVRTKWKWDLKECCFCLLVGSLVDIDHFVAAMSFDLKDATNLSRRPFAHNIFFVLIASSLCYFLVPGSSRVLYTVLISSSILSHQLRDAHRRGLYMWPLKDSPALSFPVYYTALLILPVINNFIVIGIEQFVGLPLKHPANIGTLGPQQVPV